MQKWISTSRIKQRTQAESRDHRMSIVPVSYTHLDQLCKKVRIVPREVIVRNVVAGSMAKKFGIDEGTELKTPVYEICYKNDELGDPMINDLSLIHI